MIDWQPIETAPKDNISMARGALNECRQADAISRIRSALENEALFNGFQSVELAHEAIWAFRRACTPTAIRALLDGLNAAEAENERIRAERDQAWNAALEAAEDACIAVYGTTSTTHAANSVRSCIDAIRALKDVK